MKRFTATVLSSALALGAASAQAALPDEATLYKNPQCGCCDEYARHLEGQGVGVTIVDDIELPDVNGIGLAGCPLACRVCRDLRASPITFTRSATSKMSRL